MDEFELIHEFEDRHAKHLIYEGAYCLVKSEPFYEPLKILFQDWRQRIYRFDGDIGASLILYKPLSRNLMTWDLVLAQFFGEKPFDFKLNSQMLSNLRWREVQSLLDRIKSGQHKEL